VGGYERPQRQGGDPLINTLKLTAKRDGLCYAMWMGALFNELTSPRVLASRPCGASLETQRTQRRILFSFAADPGGIGSAFHRAEEGGK